MMPFALPLWALPVAALASFAAGVWSGWSWCDTKAQADLAQAYAEAAAIEAGRDEVVAGLVKQYVEDHRVFDADKTKLVRDVAHYRHSRRNSCDLSGDWRLLHNRAAALSAPDRAAAGPVVAAATAAPPVSDGVSDADALEVVSDNYAAAAECTRKLTLWQSWWRSQQTQNKE